MGRQPKLSQGGTLAPTTLKGELEFKEVDFAYVTRPDVTVLHGLSLKIPAGQVSDRSFGPIHLVAVATDVVAGVAVVLQMAQVPCLSATFPGST